MKAVMYHYVRKPSAEVPHFTYLDADEFERQLDYFSKQYTVASRQQYLEALAAGEALKNSIILTFDDGLSDHYDFVRPALLKRGMWGIFFISTNPYVEQKLLDVHRTHYLLGKIGGAAFLRQVNSRIRDEMLLRDRAQLLEANTYTRQNNQQAVTSVKRLLNYLIRPESRRLLLDEIMQDVVGDESALAQDFYLSDTQIRQMVADGFDIGCHAHSHTLLSNLDESQQSHEISESTRILRGSTGNQLFPCFCYPYGGKHSYNADTLNLIEREGYTSGFSVESRDIVNSDLMAYRFELPRYDCNEFPHGKAVVGEPL